MSRRTLLGLSALALALASAAPTAAQISDAEREALYWQRIAEQKTRFTQADADFMAGMIGHHAQALVMSAWAPTNGASPAVQTLAARIINAQRDEIETMQRWLRDRGQAVPLVVIEGSTLTIEMEPPSGEMAGSEMAMDAGHEGMDAGQMSHGEMTHEDTERPMTDDAADASMAHDGMDHDAMGSDAMVGHNMGSHGGMDHTSMPGMLSRAQMDELEAARGVEFDRLFLRYMIQHHGGAIIMVDTLFASDGAANDEAAFKLASDVQVDQRTEIARMQQMLDAIPD